MGRRLIAATALPACLLLALGACAGPEVHEPETIRVQGEDYDLDDERVKDIRVEVRNYVEDDLEVEDTAAAMRDGRLSAQFRLVNEGDEPLRLSLTWIWKDADGMTLRVAAGGQDEQDFVLQPGEDREFSGLSPRPGAIRVECRIESRDTTD